MAALLPVSLPMRFESVMLGLHLRAAGGGHIHARILSQETFEREALSFAQNGKHAWELYAPVLLASQPRVRERGAEAGVGEED